MKEVEHNALDSLERITLISDIFKREKLSDEDHNDHISNNTTSLETFSVKISCPSNHMGSFNQPNGTIHLGKIFPKLIEKELHKAIEKKASTKKEVNALKSLVEEAREAISITKNKISEKKLELKNLLHDKKEDLEEKIAEEKQKIQDEIKSLENTITEAIGNIIIVDDGIRQREQMLHELFHDKKENLEEKIAESKETVLKRLQEINDDAEEVTNKVSEEHGSKLDSLEQELKPLQEPLDEIVVNDNNEETISMLGAEGLGF